MRRLVPPVCPSRIVLWLTCAAVLALGWVTPVRAVEYETFIDAQTEQDLYDLYVTNQISEETFNDLIDLMSRGVDLDEANRDDLYALPNLTYEDVDRVLAYRQQAGGHIVDPASLVAAGVLPVRKLASIAGFLRLSSPRISSVRGYVRYRMLWTVGDRRVPPMALQARLTTARFLTVGAAAILDRNAIGPVTWDPNRQALSSEGPRTRPNLGKYFLQWDTPTWGVIAGTYRIGFGQRLVFDTSGRYTPNGFYLDDAIIRNTDLVDECKLSTGELVSTPCPRNEERDSVSPDFDFREGLRGAAVGLKRLELPTGWLQAYAFGSYQTHSLYQYRLWDRDRCDDPHLDGDAFPGCSAPDVYLRGPRLLEPSPELSYSTLPNMFNQVTGGGNVGYWYDDRTSVGITGYGATTQWLVKGANLDFQEWDPRPYGGPWGAVGANASWGRRWADLALEVAHSFDSMDHGRPGGPAAILRHTASWDTHEIEATVRYYDAEYANPFARPIASSDQYEGSRARNEAGGRLRYTGSLLERWHMRAFADAWGEVTTNTPRLRLFVRNDVQALDWLTPGVWVEYQSRDLRRSGRDRCYGYGDEPGDEPETGSVTASDLEAGVGQGCSGERVRLTVRSRFDPHRRVNFTLQYRHDFADDIAYPDKFRQDASAFLLLAATPIDPLSLRFRLRWDWEDIQDNTRLPHTIWSYIQLSYRVRRWFVPTVRYDIRYYLDERTTTPFRTPNPEHWIQLELESRF